MDKFNKHLKDTIHYKNLKSLTNQYIKLNKINKYKDSLIIHKQ